eukprot:g6694.t1
MNVETSFRVAELAEQLTAVDISVEEKQRIIGKLRDNVEELTLACEVFVGSFTHVLETVPPQTAANPEHKLRKSILEVINRVPHTEVLKEHVPRLAETLLHVATDDNQENAIVAIKVVLDLLRAFKPRLEEVASPLLTLFIQLYDGWETMYNHYFQKMDVDGEKLDVKLNMDMQPSRQSFRVIAECPIPVLHLLQLYDNEIRPLVPQLISLMVQALRFEGPSTIPQYLTQAYNDMKFAQVKTVAFLSHCVKQNVHLMQPHEQEICNGLMNLLKSCPEVVQWRRELLISTRTLLSTDFRKTLDGRLNDFRDESAIVGKSRACYEANRHYGYAVFAELAHQTRQNLTLEQLSWIIQRSCCIISDIERPPGFHTTAVRLLFHLVEVIHRQRVNQDEAIQTECRELLQKVLLCFCVKLNSIRATKKLHNEIYPLLQNLFHGLRHVLLSLPAFSKASNAQTPSTSSTQLPPTLTEEEIRFAVKMVKGGIESLRMCIRLKMQGSITELTDLFVEALNVLDPVDFVEIMTARIKYLYDTLNVQTELHPIFSMLLEKQKIGVHLLSLIARFLTENKLELLADSEHPEYLFILKLFRLLFHGLLKPEVHNLMGLMDSKVIVLISNLVKITKTCLERINNSTKSQGYIQLLWFLFKYLHRSRLQFQELVILMPAALDLFLTMLDGPDVGIPKEMMIELCLLLPLELEKKYPVLPKLMKPLLMALKGTDEMVMLGIQTMEEWIDRLNPVFLEPAMASLVQEINLALWSHLKPQPGNPIGPKILQLLGKLGGRNRKFLEDPLQLEWMDNPDDGLRMIFSFLPGTQFLVNLDRCIALTNEGLFSSPNSTTESAGENTVYYKQQGMRFLHSCLASVMNLTAAEMPGANPLEVNELKKMITEKLINSLTPGQGPTQEQGLRIKSQFIAEKKTLTSLISSVVMLCSDPDLKEEATVFARGVCHYFAVLFFAQNLQNTVSSASVHLVFPIPGTSADQGQNSQDTVNQLEPHLFVDSVISVLTNESSQIAKCGGRAISWFLEMLLELIRISPLPIEPPSMPPEDVPSSSSSKPESHRNRNFALECGLPGVTNSLLQRVMDCCFGDNWSIKSGGMNGLEVLISDLPSSLLRKCCPEILRSILHMMLHLPAHALTHRSLLRSLLLQLIERIVVMDSTTVVSIESSTEIEQLKKQLCSTVYLVNVPELVREDCHDALNLLASHLGMSIVEILDPFVMLPEKSLKKSLEECIQASEKFKTNRMLLPACLYHMEGLSRLLIYCITQRLPSVTQLLRQILECCDFAIVLYELNEENALNRSFSVGMKLSRSRGYGRVKESLAKMLVTVSEWDVFLNNTDFLDTNKILQSMVTQFFKMLISSDENLRRISKSGLAKLIEKDKISTTDCQTPLKPVLSRLSHFASLDLNALQGGAEALRLLSDWFSPTLGEKFLENLKKWLDHDPNSPRSQRSWSLVDDTKIAASILELFHLLPSSASSFLETQRSGTERIGLVVLTIELEARLGQASPTGPIPHILWSPYRAPLTKFLIRYKKQSVSYFLAPTRMENFSYVSRFIDIIKSEVGEELLVEVLDSSGQLGALLRGSSGPSISDLLDSPMEAVSMEVPTMASVHAVYLLKTIVKLKPDWLPHQSDLYRSLHSMWRGLNFIERVSREEKMSSHMELFQCKALAKCMLNYISVHHGEVEALVELLVVFETTSKVSFGFIKEYCTEFVPVHYTHLELHELLKFIFIALDGRLSQSHSIFVVRFLVIPVLQSLKERGEMIQVATLELVYSFLKVTKGTGVEREVCLTIELLDAGRLLVVGSSSLYGSEVIREMIKYAWSFLITDNMECKSHAFLLVAHMFRILPSIENIGLQVFVNLLRCDFAETKRELVQEALDVLIPALDETQKRNTDDNTFPSWIQYCTKHMSSEGHKLNLLINLWQTVIGQPDLFYEYRSQFLGPMVNTLSRLRRPPINATAENRQMAIDMERVIVDWEVRRVKGSLESSDSQTRVVSPPPLAEETFTNMKKMVVTFLAKTLFTVPPDFNGENVKYSYLDIKGILSRALDVWPDVEFRLDFVERLIEGRQVQHQAPTQIMVTVLDLISLALQYQSRLFLVHCWHHLLSVTQRVVIMKKEDLVNKLCSAWETIFAMESDGHQTLLEELASQVLSKYLDPSNAAAVQGNSEFEISACLKILEADKENNSGMIVRFLPCLIKLLDRYASEYSIIFQNSPPPASVLSSNDPQRDSIPLPDFGFHLYNVCKILDLCGHRFLELALQRRERFVVSMITFVSWKRGRVPDRAVFYSVLLIVSSWLQKISQSIDIGLEPKLLLWTTQQISRLDATGLVEIQMKKHFDVLFLSNLYEVCTSEGLNEVLKRDIFTHVEQTMLCGIRTTTPDLRKKFFDLYQDSLGNTLLERLRYILDSQDWEHVASRFWLKQALDYLLLFLNGNEAIIMAPNSAQLVPFPFQSHNGAELMTQENDSMEVDEERTKLDELLEEHMEFVNKTRAFRTADLVDPLREYAHINPRLACHLWVQIFPIVWAALEKENQTHLAKSVIFMLLKPFHIHQTNQRPNVIQGLLEGISLCQPQPRVPSDLIKYLGKTYNAWHLAIRLLECHVVLFHEESRYFDNLNELYKMISETDMMFGFMKRQFNCLYTHAGISLMQYGYWEEAMHVFGEGTVQSTSRRLEVSSREVLLWSEEWCRCAKELNQWEELHEWAESTDNVAILADASWRLPDPDWVELRHLLQTCKDQIPDTLQYSILTVYSAFQENNLNLCNTHINQAMEQCLQKWWELPEIGTLAQIQLLQKFQQVVELCESARAFVESTPGRNLRHEHIHFTKDILESWRLRTPNISIASSIPGVDPATSNLLHLCVKDKAWSINRLASVARKHGALDLCIDIETNMYNDSYMDIHEAYLKIVEQSKAYLLMEDQKMTGLNMLCSTNLDYFPYQPIQAEIFRLQGELYRAMNNPDMANQSYSTSITLNHQQPDAWLCWGAFCDEMYEKMKPDPAGVIQLEYAVGCYFQAMHLNSSAARAMIPRCLQLLSFDRTDTVSRVFKSALTGTAEYSLPVHNWLFYIPQILSALHRPEGEALKLLLQKIGASHPQALFYYVRVHMLNAKDAVTLAFERLRQQQQHQQQQQQRPESQSTGTVHKESPAGGVLPHQVNRDEHLTQVQSNFETVKMLLDRIKHPLGAIFNSLDSMLRDIASSFTTKPEERLVSVVYALLLRCYKVPGTQSTNVPANLIRDIEGICQACFQESRTNSSQLRELRESFVQQLSPKSEAFPSTVGELTDRLKMWRNKLHRYLEDQSPSKLQLYRERLNLQDLNLYGIEMPCQYSKNPELIPDHPVYLEKFSSEIEIVRRQGSATRRLALYDSEGRKTYFILQNSPTSGQPVTPGERIHQLMKLLNRLLNKHHQCRSRFLSFFTPIFVPVWNRVRLVEEDPSFTTFLEAFEVNCAKYGKETDFYILHFKWKVYNGEGDFRRRCAQALLELSKVVSENVFLFYMYKILPSANCLWVFKKQFCTQMALSSLISVMLSIGGRIPGKILFSRSTGRVLQLDFYPSLNTHGLIGKQEEAVPFRLTGNLSAFFTPFGVEGCFMTTMVVAAMAFTQRHSNLESCLSIFFRDELLAWAWWKEDRTQRILDVEELEGMVIENTSMALENVKNLCPVVPKLTPDMQPAIVDKGVRDLVEAATQAHNLCAMDVTWHPWY